MWVDRSLRVQLFVPVVVLSFVVAVAAGLLLPWRVSAKVERWSTLRVTNLSEVIAEAVEQGLDLDDPGFVGQRLAVLRTSPDARFAVLLRADLLPVARWGEVPASLPAFPRSEETSTLRFMDLLVVKVPLTTQGGRRGWLVAGFSADQLDVELDLERRFLGGLFAVFFLVALPAAWSFGAFLTAPLGQLAQATRMATPSQLAAAAEALRPSRPFRRDERMVLISAFAEMAVRLDAQFQAVEAERQRAIAAEEEARRASDVKSTFLANMSHELRTPLNAIIGYAELVSEGESLDPQERVDIQRIARSARHLLGLINDVLDLAKVEADRLPISHERVALADLVRDVLEEVAPMIAVNGNRLVVDAPTEVGEIFSDPLRVRQCLANLLSNAAKFTEQGTIVVRAQRRADAVVVDVVDTGPGMTEAQMELLFRPFTQLDPTSTRKHGGTGLGLALTRRLARLLGGDVMVASEVGVGSTFTLRLPLQLRGS